LCRGGYYHGVRPDTTRELNAAMSKLARLAGVVSAQAEGFLYLLLIDIASNDPAAMGLAKLHRELAQEAKPYHAHILAQGKRRLSTPWRANGSNGGEGRLLEGNIFGLYPCGARFARNMDTEIL
jgi:hypothetical protein